MVRCAQAIDGGLEMGLRSVVGGEVAWHVESDPAPSKILAHHWPHVPNYGDITTVDWMSVEPVEWLTAGYPCQPFSHAGKRKGTDDERHIWPHVAAAVRALRPRHVLLENVAGHVSMGFDVVLADLAALGFDAVWGVVRASDAGAPHGRARIFVVATDTRRAGAGLNEAAGRQGRAACDGSGATLLRPADRSASADGATASCEPSAADSCGERHGRGKDGGGLGRLDGCDAGAARERERAREEPRDRSAKAAADTDDTRRGERCRPISASTQLRTTQPRTPAGPTRWGAYGPAIRRWEHVTGRAAPRPTEPGRTGPRLAPQFVEWLMGLPEGHVTAVGLPRNAQLKALGNGVVPAQCALAVRTLLSLTEARAA